MPMEFREALKAAMAESGWPIEQVAFNAGVTADAVRKWLSGSEPRRAAYDKLRRTLPSFKERIDGLSAEASRAS